MALIKITGTTNKISGALSRLQTLGKEPQEFLAVLGLEMVARTRQRIDDGVTPEGTPFAPLNPLYASGKPSGDPILKKTGSLRNELTSTIQGNSLVWGSNRIYAAVHQFGAIIKPVKAPALVFRMGGELFRRQSVTIPARPYALIWDLTMRTDRQRWTPAGDLFQAVPRRVMRSLVPHWFFKQQLNTVKQGCVRSVAYCG